MQALQHIMDGEMEKAREVLAQVPETLPDDMYLQRIAQGGDTLSDLARQMRGNRAQRRAAAKTLR